MSARTIMQTWLEHASLKKNTRRGRGRSPCKREYSSMNVTRIAGFVSIAAAASVALTIPIAHAQQPAAPAQAAPAQQPRPLVARIVAEPASLSLTAGQSVP